MYINNIGSGNVNSQPGETNPKLPTEEDAEMKPLTVVGASLLVVGGLVCGLLAAGLFYLVANSFGAGSMTSNAIYFGVGVAALLVLAVSLFPRKEVAA